ncbi:MAG TPA: hypothetical protein VHA70_12625 [Bauldia sp.]|nr:hypothetical protein [Bauldia sp.]
MELATVAAARNTWTRLKTLPPTRFAGLDRRLAAAILVVVALAVLMLLAAAFRYQPPVAAASETEGDMAMYSRIVERMHDGANYYDAAGVELRAGGYGTRSVFNWRLPTLAYVDSLFYARSLLPPLMWASLLLGLGAVAAGLSGAKLVRANADATTSTLAAIALGLSLLACATSAAVLFSEIVAGVLILGSVSAYGLGRHRAGIVLALAALFVRELAAPYVLVCIYFAWRDGRRSELWTWAIGLAAFAAFYAVHYAMVQAHVTSADIAYNEDWLRFGGLSFVLSAARFNGIFIALPLWVTAFVLPLCLLGLAAWRGPGRAGITVALYLVLFAFVGKTFNDYWGALFTPLMMLGLAFAPAALRDLMRSSRAPA